MKQQKWNQRNEITSKENKEMKQGTNEKRVEEKRNEEMKLEEKRRSVALSADTC